MSRPHSWHSTKFNEGQSDPAKTQSTLSPVWQTKYDASSFASDFTPGWDQTNLQRVSDQFSSLGSMDSLEHGSHPFPTGRLSPSKSNANSIEHLGGGKRDSAYSSFSTSSGTPDYTLSKINTASTENMLYKVNQWDSGNRPSNGRHSQNLSEGMRQDERVGYLPVPSGASDRENPKREEQPGYRHSASGRASIGPIWHIPDLKKAMAPSPPPPTPPTRSDSFAATKVHEKGLISSHPEGYGGHAQSKLQSKGLEKTTDIPGTTQRIYHLSESGFESSQNYDPQGNKSEKPHLYQASDNCNEQDYLNSNKINSLSSTDVRISHPPYPHLPYHKRQYSDESTFQPPSRISSAPKSHNINSCYSSMQELPTNSHAQLYSQNQNRRSAASLSSTGIDQIPDSHVSNRYYCVTSQQHTQGMSQASLVRVDDRKTDSATEMAHSGDDGTPVSPQGLHKDKYSVPQISQHLPNNKESSGYYRHGDIQHRGYTAVNNPVAKFNDTKVKASEIRRSQQQINVTNSETHFNKVPGPLRSTTPSQELSQSKSDGKICPQKTPMLHSLSQESKGMAEDQGEVGNKLSQEDLQGGQQVRRSDRFATTLRNEIQMRRAKLQKSRSAAALSGSAETEEEPSSWKSTENSSTSSSDGSFTSTYKDNLKEAQARVLKATSFRRRDLEPVLLEHPSAEVLPSARKDVPLLQSVSEAPLNKPASGVNQMTRICGRKRFQAEKKMRSFSEPEKINAVGVEQEVSSQDSEVSVVGMRKFFEAPGKPAYPKPVPKQNLPGPDDPCLANPEGESKRAQNEAARRGSNAKAVASEDISNESQDGQMAVQRLGTFAEYEATWNTQRKTVEPRTSGRYHSADNILDPGVVERSKPSCFHERSRSSPSDDFYGQNIPVPGRKSAEYPVRERNLSDNHEQSSSRLNHKGYSDSKQNPEPERSPSLLVGGDPERNLLEPQSNPYRSPPNSAGPSVHPTDHSTFTELSSYIKNKSSISQRPHLPHLDKYKCPEGTPPFSSVQGEAAASHCPARDSDSTPVPGPVSWKDPEPCKALNREEETAQTETTPLPPPPLPSAPPPHQATGLTQPTMEGQRSPSPQFAPQRLTDKPPVSVSLQDEGPERTDRVIDDSPTVKKVPIKIIHSESNAEKESRQYLHLSSEDPLSCQGPSVSSLSSLGSPEQSSSLFCTYTRQKEQSSEDRDLTMVNESELDPHSGVTTHQEQQAQQKGPFGDVSSNGVPSAGLSTTSHSEDDEKREVLARDIMDKDKSLADILDQSKMRTTMDLMEGIFPQGEQLVEEAHQRKRAAPKQASQRGTEERREEDNMVAVAPLVTSSTYYSTSAPKAELLIKMKDMQEQTVELDSEEELEEENDGELANKKNELIESLSRKLQVLREARESLQEDVQDNNALGEEVEATVQAVCKPNELEKFRMFVGDLDKVVSLLLSLSGRLARVENALNSLDEDAPAEERRTLTEKRKVLIRQHEDAKELKENLDRRERVVYDILTSYLSEESLADYEHFVKMKSALIIEQRKLDDKIKLGEEQLKCLIDSLPPDQRRPI